MCIAPHLVNLYPGIKCPLTQKNMSKEVQKYLPNEIQFNLSEENI